MKSSFPRHRSTLPARRSPLAAALTAATLAACGDPTAPRCSITVDRLPSDLVVAGTQVQAVARPSCDRGDPPAVRWSVSDTTIATVSATGLVTGRRRGNVALNAETIGANAVRASVPVHVEPPYDVIITPRRFDLLPLMRQAFNLSVVPTDVTPAGFPSTARLQSSDSCVAIVDANGFVATGRMGTATLTARLTAAPDVRDSVLVTVAIPSGARTFVAGISDAATGEVADPRALRGRVTVLVNLLYPNTGGRIEVRLGGRVAGTLLLAPPLTPLSASTRLPLTIDTDARDATGARRFPNGAQALDAVLIVPDAPGLPGCPVVNLGDSDSQQVTLANG
ncbi:MAG: Ig-like domain-containing protein [Gemmatirosa sp.]